MNDIDKINKRLDELESEINKLKKPVKFPEIPIEPQPTKYYYSTRCSVCGMDFSGVIGYSCGNGDCPNKVTVSFNGS